MTITRADTPLSTEQVMALLAELGVTASAGQGSGDGSTALGLAYALVGAAERNAIDTERAALRAGTSPAEFGATARSRTLAAGVRSETEEFALVEWQATRLAQAIGSLAHNRDSAGPAPAGGDRLLRAVELVAAALSALLCAAGAARDPQRDEDGARTAIDGLRQAVRALDRARASVHEAVLVDEPAVHTL
ncbi:hypothetical protein ACQEU5_08200 [Marinactinospora thermotolerans]|uniref:Uncharacterized protein n=1 Tax=Marinactinospora thermotolerans DSM 45154 TaxID=1122192 RepID=A0A1T4RA43_9ACTN|nr:hypothetical protein [Marinactinospora thermotolerans]SKA12805.1 hypothetical protein SAMN02745673_02645 [Marinactinospora thermotolerans DSM 45154]